MWLRSLALCRRHDGQGLPVLVGLVRVSYRVERCLRHFRAVVDDEVTLTKTIDQYIKQTRPFLQ